MFRQLAELEQEVIRGYKLTPLQLLQILIRYRTLNNVRDDQVPAGCAFSLATVSSSMTGSKVREGMKTLRA